MKSKSNDHTTPLSFRRVSVFILFLFASAVFAQQMAFSGDVYISSKGQMHVAVPKTLFLSGEVLVDRGTGTDYGVLSFGASSTTERADHNSHVNGFVRSHNRENFVYPIGHDNILQPVHFKSEATDAVLDFAYSHVPHTQTRVEDDLERISDEFYWSIRGNGVSKIYCNLYILNRMPQMLYWTLPTAMSLTPSLKWNVTWTSSPMNFIGPLEAKAFPKYTFLGTPSAIWTSSLTTNWKI